MVTKTVIKTKKLVYESTRVSVKQHDTVTSPTLGVVIVLDILASRKKSGHGRVRLQLADGIKGDYSPADINAIWI
jgi:hypothetical protein